MIKMIKMIKMITMTRMKRLLPRCLMIVMATAAAANGDELRNVAIGEPIPPFTLPTLDGSKLVHRTLSGKVVVLVYLSAQQNRSESAAADARAVFRSLKTSDATLIFVTSDVDRMPYFRRMLEATGAQPPLALDGDRRLYGDLGLVVFPTTIVIDRTWRLAHVISSYRSDYRWTLRAYVDHASGRLDDAALAQQLTRRDIDRTAPDQVIARHRAAAEQFRRARLDADAEQELHAALKIDSDHADVRLDLACLLMGRGRLEDARRMVDDVMASAPQHRRGRLIRGIVLFRQGDVEQAERVLTEALVYNTDPVLTHYYLGLIAEQKRDTAGALEHFKVALGRLIEDRTP